jgi:VWFA-related protein
MRRAKLPLLFILAAAGAGAQWRRVDQNPPEPPKAQAPKPEQETPTFKTGASLVRVDVEVTDGRRAVTGLKQEDFVLREEGVQRTIEAFGREAEPLEVVLLLDVSGSMGKMLRGMAAAGRLALRQLNAGDRVAVFLFARRSRMAVELTDDLALAERALQEAPLERDLGSGTVLNDALLAVAGYLREQPPFAGRRAVIVLTDNGGVHFRSPDEAVVKALSDLNAVVNAIVPGGARPPQGAAGPEVNPDFTPANVFRIARETGGEVLTSDDAGGRFRELMERIRLRYSLLVRPAEGVAGTFRRLSVDLAEDARRRYPKAEVRARAGYYVP